MKKIVLVMLFSILTLSIFAQKQTKQIDYQHISTCFYPRNERLIAGKALSYIRVANINHISGSHGKYVANTIFSSLFYSQRYMKMVIENGKRLMKITPGIYSTQDNRIAIDRKIIILPLVLILVLTILVKSGYAIINTRLKKWRAKQPLFSESISAEYQEQLNNGFDLISTF